MAWVPLGTRKVHFRDLHSIDDSVHYRSNQGMNLHRLVTFLFCSEQATVVYESNLD